MLLQRLSLALLLALPLLGTAAPLAVNPASVKIEVDARATMHGFTGKLDKADITLDGAPSPGTIGAATVRFDWADLKTGDTSRDKEMIGWATAKSPEGVFLLSKITATATADTFTAAGTLALNGQTHELSFPVKIVRTATGWDISGKTQIDHRDWGLPKIRKFGFLTVNPVVTIRFTLSASASE